MNEPILHKYHWGATELLYPEEICSCGQFKLPSRYAKICFACEKMGTATDKPIKKSNTKKL